MPKNKTQPKREPPAPKPERRSWWAEPKAQTRDGFNELLQQRITEGQRLIERSKPVYPDHPGNDD